MKKRIKEILTEFFYFKRFSKKNKSSDHFYSSSFSEENTLILKQSICSNVNSSNIYQAGGNIILDGREIKEDENRINS